MRSIKTVFVFFMFILCSAVFSLDKNDYWQIRDEVVGEKDWERGVREFKNAVREYPDELDFHLTLNWFLREAKHFGEAYEQIEKIYKKTPENQDVKNHYKWSLQSLGWERDGQNDKQGAFVVFKKAYELDPDDEWNINAYGYILRETGNLEESINILLKGTKSFPGNQYIRSNYINSVLGLGWQYDKTDKKQAMLQFKKAYDFDSTCIWAINAYGYILRELKEYAESIDVLEKGLTLHKDNPDLKNTLIYSYLNYADSLMKTGSQEKASVYFKKAAAIDSNNEAYLIYYGIFLREKKEFATALDIFKKGKKLYPGNIYFDPNITATYYEYGRHLQEKGSHTDAVKIFREASNAYPSEFYFHYYLFVSYMKLGNHAAAASEVTGMAGIKMQANGENRDRYEMEIYHRAGELSPIFCREKRFDEFLAFLEGIRKAFHNAYLYLQLKGVTVYHSGRTEEGLDIVYKAHDEYADRHPEYNKPITCSLPLKGLYIVGGNSRRDAITHAGMNRYCYDFWGCDEKGNPKKTGIEGLGENEDYIGFGKPVYAPVDGIIQSFTDDKDDLKPASSYRLIDGNFVEITDSGGLHCFLVHIKKGSVKVRAGDRVKQGDIIAELGNSGMTTIPHLHFGVYTPDYTASVPVRFETYELLNKDLGTVQKKNSIPLNNEIITGK